jgi:hypothetical protein
MKVRFYLDYTEGIPLTEAYIETYGISAMSKPTMSVLRGTKRIAFDVDLPIPQLEVLHIQDGKVVE